MLLLNFVLNKSVFVMFVEVFGFEGKNVVDGNMGMCWLFVFFDL